MKRVLIILLIAVVTIGVFGCAKKPTTPSPSTKKPSTQQPAPGSQKTLVSGMDIYNSKCQACHGTNGEGVKSKGPKINTAEWSDPQKVVKVVKEGKGSAMPSFKGTLSKEQITAVSDYVAKFKK